ncbi:peptide ABC transporter substrate-binding protein [Planococcus sp. CPCC 101016]|uniref:peptide ABC transporter substrate-binding protein n=1 Tax=Planococcus sp. CPCC 101016 TaxID=2599617 RepID=UPI0011B4D9B1|nr:peptide ABC transporter substrate-binding protein [Planococcus sp. CPCC 101016]TWT07292.1 peptide ABC transporter substrate-binding protein [Planococcus sp. CPCC 101016]
MKVIRLWGFWILLAGLVVILSSCTGESASEQGSTENSGEPADMKGGGESSEADSVQELNLIEASELPTMDSALAEDVTSFIVLDNVNEGLFRLNKESIAEPALAESEPEISEDGLTYTFKLRESKWSDGSPLTAEDFVYSWQRAVEPATGSPYGPYMMSGTILNADQIAAGEMDNSELGIKAIDEMTLEVTLERPIPYFMSLMAFPTFFPQKEEYVNGKGEDFASNSENVLYNGPFVLNNWDGTGMTWTLEKNLEYWDEENVTLETINVDVVKETTTAVNLYNSGEKDMALLAGEMAIQNADNPEVVKYLSPYIFYLKFNQERNGEATVFANENIRKAIAMAYNKQDLVDIVLADGSLPANYLVPKEFSYNDNKEDFREINGDMLEHDVEEAKKLWEIGKEEEGFTDITLELLGDDQEIAKNMDAYMKAQLEQNLEGLTVNLKAVPFSVRLELDEAQDYDFEVFGWAPDYQDPMTFIDLYVSGSPQNLMSYSNEEFDSLIEKANGELASDLPARWEAMAEAERILIEEDAAIAPIFQQGTMMLQKPYVKDVIKHPFGGDYSYKWAYISGKE